MQTWMPASLIEVPKDATSMGLQDSGDFEAPRQTWLYNGGREPSKMNLKYHQKNIKCQGVSVDWIVKVST